MRRTLTLRAARGCPELARRAALIAVAAVMLLGLAPLPVTASAASKPLVAKPRQLIQAATRKTTREVFGYALSSSLGNPSWGYTTWNFSLLGTVAYFAIHIAPSGVITDDSGWQTWNSSVVTNLINTAHANGTKVVMTIDLHDFSPGNPTMCQGLSNRDTTVLQTVNAMRARGADGVNVDYEGLNGTCPNGQTARAMMTDLVYRLRAALGSGPYLSVATYGSSAMDPIGFFDIAGMSPYVDSFFVMAYDLEYSNYTHPPTGCPTFCLGPTAPLAGYYWNDASVVSQYLAVVQASQVILGVPYYGRKACVIGAVPNAFPTGSVVAETYLDAVSEASDPSVRPGSYVTHRDANDASGLERWDTWYNTSLNCVRELYIDDATSLSKKYDLVNQQGLRGVGLWTLNYGGGSPELWAALSNHFEACTVVSASTAVASPQPAGTQVHVAATASGCSNPLYEFWILPPGGSWTLAQQYTTSPNFYWNTSGKASGTYRISAWARDARGTGLFGTSPNTYDGVSAFDFTVTPTCPVISTTSAPPTTAGLGSVVTISATASGCPNPLYEFWLQPPGGAWTLAQGYSTNAAYNWNTAGKPAGSYRFAVWTRESSSPNAYDGVSGFQYTLTITACSATTASAAPPSTAAAGTLVSVTSAATGCPNPLYAFWLLPPGGTWSLAQAYSSSASFAWNTAGKPAGSYRLSVWARDAGSPGVNGTLPYTYDSVGAFQYTLTSSCQAVGVSTLPQSTASVGNVVTISASTSACPNPLYELWVLPPGGNWTLGQAYSSSGTFKWSSAGKAAGSYRFSVWARDSVSPGVSGSSPNTYDAVSSFQYTLVFVSCVSVSASTLPSSAASVGNVVTVTASASGCSNPMYEFWIQTPGGSWTLGQGYSTSATFKWNTSGSATGSYRISVWARDAASSGAGGTAPNTYDSVAAFQYTLA